VKVLIVLEDILTFEETFTILGEIGNAFLVLCQKPSICFNEIVATISSLFRKLLIVVSTVNTSMFLIFLTQQQPLKSFAHRVSPKTTSRPRLVTNQRISRSNAPLPQQQLPEPNYLTHHHHNNNNHNLLPTTHRCHHHQPTSLLCPPPPTTITSHYPLSKMMSM
jgi:hypothetical protein